jgi:integrase
MTDAVPKRKRAPANRLTFTELGLARLKPSKLGPVEVWDSNTRGLSLLVSYGGTKTYRSTFYLHGRPASRKLGRFGEIDLNEARKRTRTDRQSAFDGIDPRQAKKVDLTVYGDIVDQFIEHCAKPRQRTWDQTERILKRNCAVWLKKPMASITKHDVRALLRGFIADGHGHKAAITLTWLKTLWKWASKEDLIAINLMQSVDLEIETTSRDRVYNDEEIKVIWTAADKLDPAESAYVKLLILLAPRKTALSLMRHKDLDSMDNPTLWTTPFELTKSKKRTSKKNVYLTPLPPLAQRIIKALPRSNNDRLFPSLTVRKTKAGQPVFVADRFLQRFTNLGVPKDFSFHVVRHTIATWLENKGHSEWERGLVLNHSGPGTVTAGYSHGYPLELKLKLLTEWADHVESLIQPEGVVLLR